MDITSVYTSIGCNRFSNVCDIYRPVGGPAGDSDVAIFGAGKFIALWNVGTSQGIHTTLVGHAAQVTTVKVLPAEPDTPGRFISGDESGTIKQWEAQDEAGDSFVCVRTLASAHTGSVSSLGVGIGCSFASGGVDGVVKVWSWKSSVESDDKASAPTQSIDLAGKIPLDMSLCRMPDSEAMLLTIAPTNRKLEVYTSANKSSPFIRSLLLEGHEDWIRCLSVTTVPAKKDGDGSQDDLMLASGSQDGYIRLWRIAKLVQPTSEVEGYDVESSMERANDDLRDNGLDDEMLDEFERRMTGDVAGERANDQLSTKAHIISIDGAQYGISLDALLIGHEGWISNLHWSPREKAATPVRLLSTSADNSMIIWSPEESSSIWYAEHRFGEMSGKGLGLFGALWTRKSRTSDGAHGVLANGWNGGFHFWTPSESEKYAPTWAPTGHALAVKDLTWGPHGDYLISVSTDQTSRIHARCRSSSGEETQWGEMGRPQIHGYDMTCVAPISRTRFVSGADEKVVRIFDATRGFVSSLRSLAVTADDVYPETQSVGASVPPLGLSNRALSKAIDPASTGDDKGFNQEHVSISDELTTLPVESVLSSSTLWPEVEKLYGHGYELIAIAASPSGKYLATACKATTPEHAVVRLYDTDTWRQVGDPLAGHSLTITRITFSSDERYILTCSRDRTWRMFIRSSSGAGYEPVAADKPHTRIVWDCVWGPDEQYFATASRDKSVKIWSSDGTTSKWTLQQTIKTKDAATAVAAAIEPGADSHLLAVGFEVGGIDLYRLDPSTWTCELVRSFPPGIAHVDQVHRLLWSQRDGQMELASCSEDRSIKLTRIARRDIPSASARPAQSISATNGNTLSLSLDEYKRYGRQMILPGFGQPGQLALKGSDVAVIGAGGLGCPALQYLVGAGVGSIAIFDFDRVETSNLHRQILHTTDRVGWYKAESAKVALRASNPHVGIKANTDGILPTNAIEILRGFSLILDCTDRPETRYLISDAAVRLGVPLVSGAAVGHSGQWAVYGGLRRSSLEGGPAVKLEKRGCYRCIWPKPVSTQARVGAGTCEEEGVWGPVTGIVGTQMAAEAIRLIVGMNDSGPRLHLMSLDPSATPFRSVKIRGPSDRCIACGPSATVTDDLGAIDYDAFCGSLDQLSNASQGPDRWTAQELRRRLNTSNSTLILDVREPTEYGICSLPGSINVSLEEAISDPREIARRLGMSVESDGEVVFICRKGNDSQLAAAALQSVLPAQSNLLVRDLVGGLQAWSREVDLGFPLY